MTTPTPAQIVNRRERLGLSQTELAKLLDVAPRAVRRWEAGERAMSLDYSRRLNELEANVESEIRRKVKFLESLSGPSRVLTVFRTQADQEIVLPHFGWPASLGRAIARQVWQQVYPCEIVFWQP